MTYSEPAKPVHTPMSRRGWEVRVEFGDLEKPEPAKLLTTNRRDVLRGLPEFDPAIECAGRHGSATNVSGIWGWQVKVL